MPADLKRIFITGATGFIGSHLARRLIQEGYDVAVMKRATSDCSRIRDLADSITTCDVDLRNSGEVTESVAEYNPDAILHLVTYYVVEHTPHEIGVMLDTNVKGTVNLLEAAKESGITAFINTSTCAVYEDIGRKLAENDNIRPQNLYALSKLLAEEACSFYADNYGVNTVTLRLFPPYGPADNERRLIPYVTRCLLNGESPNLTTGKQKWDFVYVDDIVDAFLAALRAFPTQQAHEIFNIGTGNAVSIFDVVTKIKEITGADTELKWGAVPHRKNEVWLNSAEGKKSSEILGWQAKTNIDAGLAETISWFRKHWNRS